MANKQAAEIERALIGYTRARYIMATERAEAMERFAFPGLADPTWRDMAFMEYELLAYLCEGCHGFMSTVKGDDEVDGEPPSWEWCPKHGGAA